MYKTFLLALGQESKEKSRASIEFHCVTSRSTNFYLLSQNAKKIIDKTMRKKEWGTGFSEKTGQ